MRLGETACRRDSLCDAAFAFWLEQENPLKAWLFAKDATFDA